MSAAPDQARASVAQRLTAEGLCVLAADGDRDAIADLAGAARLALEANAIESESQPLCWLLAALARLAEGHAPNHAFGWARTKAGRPKAARPAALGWVVPARLSVLMQTNPTMTRALAVEVVAREFSLSSKRVEAFVTATAKHSQKLPELLRFEPDARPAKVGLAAYRRLLSALKPCEGLMVKYTLIEDGTSHAIFNSPVAVALHEELVAGSFLCVSLVAAAAGVDFIAATSGEGEFAKENQLSVGCGDLLNWRATAGRFVAGQPIAGDLVGCACAAADVPQGTEVVFAKLLPGHGRIALS